MAGYWDRDDDRFNRTPYRGGYESQYDYSNRNDRGDYGNRDNDRGFFERAGDEVRSWFGDDDAERRRMTDERRDERRDRFDYDRGSDYRHNYGSQNYNSQAVRRDLDRDDLRRDDPRRGGYGSSYGSNQGGSNYGGPNQGGSSYGRSEQRGSSYGRSNYGDSGYGGSNQGGLHHGGSQSGNWGQGSSQYGNPNQGFNSNRDYDRPRGDMNRENDRWGSQSYGSQDYGRGQSGGWSHDREDRNWGSNYGGRDNRRGLPERAGDEVRSWFGDDDAERRRRMDDRYDNDRDYNDRKW